MDKAILLPAAISFLCLSGIRSTAQNPGPDVFYVAGSSVKICQLIGDYDKGFGRFTQNQTYSKYGLTSTDLGSSFRHNDTTYFLFGDVWLDNHDPIAFSTDTFPDDGIELNFIKDFSGKYRPVVVPGISQGGMEVPVEGVSLNGKMYVYLVTDWNGSGYGRCVVAGSNDNGHTLRYLYDFSSVTGAAHFMNISIQKVNVSEWPHLPKLPGSKGLLIFGAGNPYRGSNIRLAFQSADSITAKKGIRYLSGFNSRGDIPVWSAKEQDAVSLFEQPCAGEFSVSYNSFIRKWILLYNCIDPSSRGINFRTADFPWGPWSKEQLLFAPWSDKGYCYFMHVSWLSSQCDNVSDNGRENEWGGEYGPYQIDDMAVGTDSTTTIYFTMSTWNPYTVVLMKSTLRKPVLYSSVSHYNSGTKGLTMNIFPNPATNNLTVEVLQKSAIEIIDSHGQIIRTIQTRGNDATIDLSGLAGGIYIVKAKTDKEIATRKFIKR